MPEPPLHGAHRDERWQGGRRLSHEVQTRGRTASRYSRAAHGGVPGGASAKRSFRSATAPAPAQDSALLAERVSSVADPIARERLRLTFRTVARRPSPSPEMLRDQPCPPPGHNRWSQIGTRAEAEPEDKAEARTEVEAVAKGGARAIAVRGLLRSRRHWQRRRWRKRQGRRRGRRKWRRRMRARRHRPEAAAAAAHTGGRGGGTEEGRIPTPPEPVPLPPGPAPHSVDLECGPSGAPVAPASRAREAPASGARAAPRVTLRRRHTPSAIRSCGRPSSPPHPRIVTMMLLRGIWMLGPPTRNAPTRAPLLVALQRGSSLPLSVSLGCRMQSFAAFCRL